LNIEELNIEHFVHETTEKRRTEDGIRRTEERKKGGRNTEDGRKEKGKCPEA
jgi:hypothetical protein